MIDAIKNHQSDLIKAFIETFNMLLVSMIVSFVIGLAIGLILFLTRKNNIYQNKFIYAIFSVIVNIIRSIPFILFIIVLIPFTRFLVGTGFGVRASKVSLSLIGIATFARLSEQALLSVNKQIYETSYALGANTYFYIKDFLLKEARHQIVLSFTSTTISLVSYSTVMGVIGGGGLGYLAISEGYHNFNYPLMWVIIIMIVIIVQIIQTIGNMLAKKLDKR